MDLILDRSEPTAGPHLGDELVELQRHPINLEPFMIEHGRLSVRHAKTLLPHHHKLNLNLNLNLDPSPFFPSFSDPHFAAGPQGPEV
jgi:hypothetical protein